MWRASSPAVARPSVVLPDQYEKDLVGYICFCQYLGIDPGSPALLAYGVSQKAAGLDPSAIANRIDMLTGVTKENVIFRLQSHRVKRFAAALRKEKANAGGPKRKLFLTLDYLMEWVCPSSKTKNDLEYQVVFFICIATGCRPEETHTMKIRIKTEGIEVQWNGRKNCPTSGAHFLLFPFSLSSPPPSHVKKYLEENINLPKIGTRSNVSSCINSWLTRFKKNNPSFFSFPPLHTTSTCPRVRMDNILRDLVDAGKLTIHVYEQMIGHTINVSDVSYRR